MYLPYHSQITIPCIFQTAPMTSHRYCDFTLHAYLKKCMLLLLDARPKQLVVVLHWLPIKKVTLWLGLKMQLDCNILMLWKLALKKCSIQAIYLNLKNCLFYSDHRKRQILNGNLQEANSGSPTLKRAEPSRLLSTSSPPPNRCSTASGGSTKGFVADRTRSRKSIWRR